MNQNISPWSVYDNFELSVKEEIVEEKMRKQKEEKEN